MLLPHKASKRQNEAGVRELHEQPSRQSHLSSLQMCVQCKGGGFNNKVLETSNRNTGKATGMIQTTLHRMGHEIS